MTTPTFLKGADIERADSGDAVIDTVVYDQFEAPEDIKIVARRRVRLDGAFKRPNLTDENYHLTTEAWDIVNKGLADGSLDPEVHTKMHFHNVVTQLIAEFEEKKASRPMENMESMLQKSQPFQPQISTPPPPQDWGPQPNPLPQDWGPRSATVNPQAGYTQHHYPPQDFQPQPPPMYPVHPYYQQHPAHGVGYQPMAPNPYQPPQFQPPQPRQTGSVVRKQPQAAAVVQGRISEPSKTVFVRLDSAAINIDFETHWQIGISDDSGNFYVMVLIVDESQVVMSADVVAALGELDANYSIKMSESMENIDAAPSLSCAGPSLIYRFDGRMHLVVPLAQ